MADPKVGDFIECAVWLDGTETEQQITMWKERDCIAALTHITGNAMIVIGPVDFEIKYPGEDRVPQVPDHITGHDVRLMVAVGKVVGVKPALNTAPSFLNELERKDLETLRRATRRAYATSNPGMPALTNPECDAIIAQLGPTAAGNAIRAATGAWLH